MMVEKSVLVVERWIWEAREGDLEAFLMGIIGGER